MNKPALGNLDQQNRWPAPDDLTAARFFAALLSVLAVLSLSEVFASVSRSDRTFSDYPLRWQFLVAAGCLLALGSLAAALSLWLRKTLPWPGLLRAAERLGPANLLLALLVWAVYLYGALFRLQNQFSSFTPRLWLFWLAAGLAALFLRAAWRGLPYFWCLLATAAGLGTVVRLLGFLPDLSASPFTLGWSEASRFYYASLPLASQVYGMPIPLSPWHASRYLILGLPFAIPQVSLGFMRFYQVLLWVGLNLTTGLALIKRFRLGDWRIALLGACWAGLFLLQGPVYYHLLVCILVVLLGYDGRKPWRTAVMVLLASLWAGISRVNWFPVPAMLAITLYLLETPLTSGPRNWLRYLVPPALWTGVGLLSAAAAQAVYVRLSGQPDPSIFNSTYSSALLWYRLLPNPTSPMGVLPAILLISLPLLALMLVTALKSPRAWHPLRLLGLAGMLAVLFVGGLVVSTKIGGGSNIHNVDAYIVLVLVAGCAFWMGAYTPQAREAPRPWRPWPLTFLIIALPLAWGLAEYRAAPAYDAARDAEDLAQLTSYLKPLAARGEVLFITQRQLLTFGLVKGIPIVPDYEVLTLSEMALARNPAYLARYNRDLSARRFSAIVVDPQREYYQDPAVDSFAEENNAWVEYITKPILASYQTGLRIERISGPTIDVMIPKP